MKTADEFLAVVLEGNLEQAKSLLDAEPGLASFKPKHGSSMVLLCLDRGYVAMAELLATRIELNLFEAAALGRIEKMQNILGAIPEAVHAISPEGITPLSYAVHFGHIEAVTLLLESGADPNQRSKNPLGLTSLHCALAQSYTAISLLLLSAGANPNLAASDGWTPLHFAADLGDAEIARFLMDIGADFQIANSEGKTAAEHAVDVGHDHVADVIFELAGSR